jgi:hypothetical protein
MLDNFSNCCLKKPTETAFYTQPVLVSAAVVARDFSIFEQRKKL